MDQHRMLRVLRWMQLFVLVWATTTNRVWGESVTLTFNHTAGEWSVTPATVALEGEGDIPTLYLRRGDSLEVIVTNTNKLLYEAEYGELKKENEQSVEQLNTLFGLLGGVLGSGVAAPGPQILEKTNLTAAVKYLESILRELERKSQSAITYIQYVEGTHSQPRAWTTLQLHRQNTCQHTSQDNLEVIEESFTCLTNRLSAYLNTASPDGNLVTSVEKVLMKEGDARQAIARLGTFEQTVCSAAGVVPPTGLCTPRRGELETIKLGKWPSHAIWESKQTQEVKIAKASPYKESIVEQLGERSPKFMVRWKYGNLFGVGVGLTHTELVSPEYSAVAPQGATDKVVTKTGESSRSGQLGLFANYRLLQQFYPKAQKWFIRPGIEIGAGLDKDKPAGFAGISIEIGRYARIGYGRTWQEIIELDSQQEDITVVADNDAIKTRKDFARDEYISFSFAIDSLKLFSAPKEE